MSNCTVTSENVINVLRSSGEYVVLSNTVPYKNVLVFTGIVENLVDVGVGTILKKEFRYSIDGETFSEFQELSVSSIKALGSFDLVYFQFRYILLSGGPVTVVSVYLTYNLIPSKEPDIAPSNIQDESKIYAYPIIYKSNFVWEPYKINRAVRLYKDLNLMVNNIFGHDVHYYRVLPYGRSKDVFLMEYSLFEHDQKQCIKVIVPNNEFPDNKLNMGPFGVDFELPFEVQIDKDYYQKIFGAGSGPQKRDILFFPIINRIYEVSSSYLFRDFMNEPLYFKVTLIKWLPKSNVEQTEEVNTLESFTASAQSLFGEQKAQEEEKITNPKQFNISSTFEDPVRSFVDINQEIGDIKLLNYYTLIAEHFYKLSSQLSEPLIKCSLPDVFTKNETYYVRVSPDSIQPDEQYFYSMKKLVYKGKSLDNLCVFLYLNGNSQIQSSFTIPQLFNSTSQFGIYSTEYTGATAETPLAKCNVDAFSYRNRVVEYKAISDFPKNEDRSYSAWFRLNQNTSQIFNITSFSFDMYTKQININLDRPASFLVGDMVSIKRSITSSFLLFGTIVTILNSKNIIIEVDQEIIDFVKVSFPTWENYTDLKIQKTYSNVLLNGWLNNKGIKIEIFENRHVKIYSNSTYQYFSLPNSHVGLEYDMWYGIFINFSNIFKQLTVNIWKIQWNSSTNLPATTDLLIIMNKTVPMSQVDRSSCINYYLEPCNMDLTNIRLFNKVVETDKQVLILNQNIVKDAQWSIIIDNALPQSRLPYIGYTR